MTPTKLAATIFLALAFHAGGVLDQDSSETTCSTDADCDQSLGGQKCDHGKCVPGGHGCAVAPRAPR